jgi:AraC-like DNA-binding protein
MEDLVLTCFTRVGTACHRGCHEEDSSRSCAGSPLETAIEALTSTTEPFQRLHAWRHAFWSFLDATHPVSAAERAAGILRESFRRAPSLDDLARRVACSRRALTRAFLIRYGMSCGEFAIRLHLRAFIQSIRTGATADAAAFDVGYTSYQGLAAALVPRTGVTAAALQRLSPHLAEALLEGPLGLSPGETTERIDVRLTPNAARLRRPA